jgi:E3 ubiquitin-protein ligase SHPRH
LPCARPRPRCVDVSVPLLATHPQVQAEFEIPSQSRYVVPVELSAIEQHYYDDTRERQIETIRRYQEGRGMDRAVLRQCLLALRQICTHLQVGQMAGGAGEGAKERRAQRLNLGSSLMTMKEALQKMKAEHAAAYLLECRNQVSRDCWSGVGGARRD